MLLKEETLPLALEFCVALVAILGAPFLLSTLAMFVVGASAFSYRRRREQGLRSGAAWAMELPEKLNSVLRVREGNITGDMVFQSTVPVTLGVLFTPWELGPLNLFSAALAILSGSFDYAMARRPASLHSRHLMVGGACYFDFLLVDVFHILNIAIPRADRPGRARARR